MKTVKYTLILTITLLIAAPVWAADIQEILSRRNKAAKLPPSSSVILYHGTTFTLYEDGRMDRQEHIVRYLRTKRAWDTYGDPEIPYDSRRQELEILISRTYTPEGKKVDTTPNGFNPIVPFGLDLAPDFTDYRQMVVTHLGIVDDAVTELKYTIRDKEPLYPWAWGDVLLSSDEPTLEREVVVKAPKDHAFGRGWANGAPEGVLSQSGEYQVWTCRMTDLKGVDLAEATPYSVLFLLRIQFTTCPNMEAFVAELEKRFSEAAESCCSFADEISPFRAIKSEDVKLDSVVTFVKNRIALKRFDDIGMLLSFRKACRTYNTGYGSPADLAVLYTAILKDLGFKTEVYLLGNAVRSVAGLIGNEKYTIRLNISGIESWLDPTTGEIWYHLPESAVITGIYPACDMKWMPPTEIDKNRISLELELTMESDGSASGWIYAETTGQLAFFNTAREKGAEGFIKHWTDGLFAKSEVKNVKLLKQQANDVCAKGDLDFPASEDLIDGILRMEMPWNVNSIHGLLPTHLALHHADRNVPVFLDHAGEVEVNIRIHVPDNYQMVVLPTPYQGQTDGISFTREVTFEETTLSFYEKTTFPKRQINPQSWKEWRKILLEADRSSNRTLLLQTDVQ